MIAIARFLILFVLLCVKLVWADSASPASTVFNINAATSHVSALSKLLVKNNLQLKQLNNTVLQLQGLNAQAEQCVITTGRELYSLTSTLKAAHSGQDPGSVKLRQQKILNLQQRLANCRVFGYHTEQTIAAFNAAIDSKISSKLWLRDIPASQAFTSLATVSLDTINFSKMYQISGLQQLNLMNLSLLSGFIILTLLLAKLVSYNCKHWLERCEKGLAFNIALLATLRSYIWMLLLLALLSLFFSVIFVGASPIPSLQLVSYVMFLYVSCLCVMTLFANPPQPANNLLGWKQSLVKAFILRFIVLATLLLTMELLIIIFRQQEFRPEILSLLRSVNITLLSLVVVWFGWLISRLPRIQNLSSVLPIIIKIILIIILLAMLVTEWMGYHGLATYLLHGVLLSSLTCFIFMAAIYLIDSADQIIKDEKHHVTKYIHYLFGLKSRRTLPELVLVKFVLYILMAVSFVWLIMLSWDVPVPVMNDFQQQFFKGLDFAGVTFVPAHLLTGIVAFSMVHLIGRVISAHYRRRQQYGLEKEMQVAMASIISYVSFAAAVVVAFLLAGINFTGLAIIAGSLSVGIGLGLRDIVNNFVCGLILLLEKPIKPGDRIIVGEMEGYVRKVSIRSTRIRTRSREDVIVPNSDLITNPVVNYMYRE